MSLEELGKPFVHGAIAGWYGQVATVFPGDRTLDKIYKGKKKRVWKKYWEIFRLLHHIQHLSRVPK